MSILLHFYISVYGYLTFPQKLLGIQILLDLKHSRALALKDEKFANSFKNKVSRVEQTDRMTDRQADTEFY